jgi:hypothetical protein
MSTFLALVQLRQKPKPQALLQTMTVGYWSPGHINEPCKDPNHYDEQDPNHGHCNRPIGPTMSFLCKVVASLTNLAPVLSRLKFFAVREAGAPANAHVIICDDRPWIPFFAAFCTDAHKTAGFNRPGI